MDIGTHASDIKRYKRKRKAEVKRVSDVQGKLNWFQANVSADSALTKIYFRFLGIVEANFGAF